MKCWKRLRLSKKAAAGACRLARLPIRAMPHNLKKKSRGRYSTAKVLQFTSPVGGDWIRVRVAEDDKKRAQEVMRETHTDARVFLVRLD